MTDNDDGSIPGRKGGEGLPLKAALFTTFLSMLFGANAVAIKISLVGLGVFTTAALRFSVAFVVVWLWTRITGRSLAISRGQLLQLLPAGVLFFAQLSLFYVGQSTTTASHGTLIANALPFVILVLAHLFIPGETITVRKTIGLLLGFIGVIVLFFDQVAMADDMLKGDMIILSAVIVWGCNAVYVKRIINNFSPVQVTLYPMAIAVPFFVLCSVFVDAERVRFVDTAIITALFYQTFVTASFGMVAWNSLVRTYGTTVLHSFVFVMPISGVFFGVILLGEPLTTHLLLSIFLVTGGLVIVNR